MQGKTPTTTCCFYRKLCQKPAGYMLRLALQAAQELQAGQASRAYGQSTTRCGISLAVGRSNAETAVLQVTVCCLQLIPPLDTERLSGKKMSIKHVNQRETGRVLNFFDFQIDLPKIAVTAYMPIISALTRSL